jgi:hypothetical protein
MAGDFFTDPQFLALLRVWEERRGDALMPVWDDALPARFPPELAPYLLAARHDASGDGVYVYVGTASVNRFGRDPTGQRVGQTLSGPILAYVLDLVTTMRRLRAPVFSASIYHIADDQPIRTGRLLVPFAGDVVLVAQLFEESPSPLERYSREGTFEETERRRVVRVPDALRRLEEAARFRRLGRSLHVASIAKEAEALARQFDETVTEALPLFRAG